MKFERVARLICAHELCQGKSEGSLLWLQVDSPGLVLVAVLSSI